MKKLYREESAGNFFRKKSIKALKKEFEHYKNECDIDCFYFWADTFFSYTDKEFDEFIEMYSDIKIPFWCQTRPETINEEQIGKLRGVGLHRMSIGIEHGNEEFRKKVLNRRMSNKTIIRALEIVADYSLPASCSVNNIIGFPAETPALAMDTIELNRQIADKVDTMSCSVFMPYHGTPLRELSLKLGFIEEDTATHSLSGEPVLNMPQFPTERVKRLFKTFNLYAKFDKSRWPEIKIAEGVSPQAEGVFKRLRKEYIEQYFSKEVVR